MDIGDNKILEGMGGKLPSGKLPSGKHPVGYLILGLAALVSLGVILWFIFKEDYPTCTGFDCSTDDNSLSTSPGDIECPADPCTTIDCCTVVPTGGGSARDSDSDRDSDSNSGSDSERDSDSDSSLICSTPSSEDKVPYTVTETSLENAFTDSTVTATCASGYVGPPVVTPCAASDQPYQLSGCEPLLCSFVHTDSYASPEVTNDGLYTLDQSAFWPDAAGTAGNQPWFLNLGGDNRMSVNVTADCATNVQGLAVVSPCTSNNTPYLLSGCHQ